jgi:hypothetical protein
MPVRYFNLRYKQYGDRGKILCCLLAERKMAEQKCTITNSAAAHPAWTAILLKKLRDNFTTVWSSTTLVDLDCLTVLTPPPPPTPVSMTDIRRYMYDYPARTSRNVTIWLPKITACRIISQEIKVALRRVNVCSSRSWTEMCNKDYSTGQKGAWSSVWQLILRLCGGHWQLPTEQLKLGLIPRCRILPSSGKYIPKTNVAGISAISS